MSKPPKQVKDLVPAKNGDKIGLANTETQKFFVLDHAYLNIWLLCDGKRSEDKIAEDFITFLKENAKGKKAKIDEKLLKEEIKTILNKLRKFGLIN
jgi:hypothetical protein